MDSDTSICVRPGQYLNLRLLPDLLTRFLYALPNIVLD